MAAFVRDFNVLQQELEKTKESLKDVDDNIKKLTGRDPTEPGRTAQQRRILLGFNERGATDLATNRGGRKRVLPVGKWAVTETDAGPRKKRGNIASRLGPRPSRSSQDSGDADEMVRKPSVPSSVVATSRDSLTRKDMLDAQGKDERGMARNKRMFGLLLGTLQKFKDEAKDKKDKHDQRKRVELKLEEKAQQEKDEIRKERELLFQIRREKQTRIRLLEQKMELVSTHEKCEAEIRKLTNFICTKTKPCIFYLPKIHTPATESRLSETTKVVNEMIAERRRRLTAEINELMGPSSFAHLAGEDEHSLDMEEDDSENIPAGLTGRRDGGGQGSLDGDKRYPVHYRGSSAGNKDWSRNKDKKPSSKRSSGGGGGNEHHHHQHHQDSKTGKHGWEVHRVSKSCKDQQSQLLQQGSTAITSSSAVSSKSVSNKWQLLMEMDSGLEEDEDRVVVPNTAAPAMNLPMATLPLSSSSPSALVTQRDEDDGDDDDEERDEREVEETGDKREVCLEENINGTEDRRLVDASGVASCRRVVLAADVDDEDGDDDDDDGGGGGGSGGGGDDDEEDEGEDSNDVHKP